jgi:hypothetical protein
MYTWRAWKALQDIASVLMGIGSLRTWMRADFSLGKTMNLAHQREMPKKDHEGL